MFRVNGLLRSRSCRLRSINTRSRLSAYRRAPPPPSPSRASADPSPGRSHSKAWCRRFRRLQSSRASRQFTLAVAQVTTPDDHSQTLNPPHPKTILVGEGSPVFLADGRCGKPRVRRRTAPRRESPVPGREQRRGQADGRAPDRRSGDRRCRPNGDCVAAQVKVGENLLPATADTNAYTLFQNSPDVHGTVTARRTTRSRSASIRSARTSGT